MLDAPRVRLESLFVDHEAENVEAARRVEVELVVSAQRHHRVDVDRLPAKQRRTRHAHRHADRPRAPPRPAGLVHRLAGRLAEDLHAATADLLQAAEERPRCQLLVDLLPLLEARRLLVDVGARHARHRTGSDVAIARPVRAEAAVRDGGYLDHHQRTVRCMETSSGVTRDLRARDRLPPSPVSAASPYDLPNGFAIP